MIMLFWCHVLILCVNVIFCKSPINPNTSQAQLSSVVSEISDTESERSLCSPSCNITVLDNSVSTNVTTTVRNCSLTRSTSRCESQYVYSESHVPMPCSDREIDYYLYPRSDAAYARHFAYPSLVFVDITFISIMPIHAAKLHISCIEATPNEAKCMPHKENKPLAQWPCRLFDLSNIQLQPHEQFVFPNRFSYPCFSVYEQSTFRVNVTLYNRNVTGEVEPYCVSSLFLKSPFRQNINNHTHPSIWQPILFVDTTPVSGVWIRWSLPPKSLNISTMRLTVVKFHQHRRVFSEDIRTERMNGDNVAQNLTGWLVSNLPRGKYEAHIETMHPSCANNSVCTTQNKIQFILETDHLLAPVPLGPFYIQDGIIVISVALIVVCAIFLVFALVILYWLKFRPQFCMRNVDRSFERSPKVMILYTDDSLVHRNCVLELANYLQHHAHCRVLLDDWAMRTPGISPNQWLLRAINDAQFYIVVFSKGTSLAFQGVHLPPQRHWAELFNTGFYVVLNKLFEQLNVRNILDVNSMPPFVWVQFDYSNYGNFDSSVGCGSEYETLLYNLPCSRFNLPADLWRLVCHLHVIEDNNPDSNFTDGFRANLLKNAVTNAANYYQQHPNWMQARNNAAAAISTRRDSLVDLSPLQVNNCLEDPNQAYIRITQLRQTLRRLDTNQITTCGSIVDRTASLVDLHESVESVPILDSGVAVGNSYELIAFDSASNVDINEFNDNHAFPLLAQQNLNNSDQD